jgi:hypothetical protein
MATRNRKTDTVYGVARGRHEHGYGHVTIHVYGLFGSNATLMLDCQSGGTAHGETYGWKHGLTPSHSVLGVHELHKGYLLMRRMKKELDKVYEADGSPGNFAEYAMRVLRAAGIRKVHMHPGVNSRFFGDELALPSYDPVRQGDILLHELRMVEQAVIHWS